MSVTINATNFIKKIMIKIAEDPKSEITHKDTYNALVSMIKWTRQFKNKSEIISFISNGLISHKAWAKEMCTIKFCLPRQSGHTTFLKKIIGKLGPCPPYSELFKSPMVLFPNHNVAMSCGFCPGWSWVDLANEQSRGFKALGRRLDGVIVDCSSVLSSNSVERIYDIFSTHAVANPNFVFVFLE